MKIFWTKYITNSTCCKRETIQRSKRKIHRAASASPLFCWQTTLAYSSETSVLPTRLQGAIAHTYDNKKTSDFIYAYQYGRVQERLWGQPCSYSTGIALSSFGVEVAEAWRRPLTLTFRHRASSIYDRRFDTLQRTFFIHLINKYISLSDICLTVHHWYQ